MPETPAFVAFASLAGLCGALSGFAVKIATSGWALGPLPPAVTFAVFMLANVLLTGQMWRFYLKALGLGPTPATMMTSTAVNMTVSAAVGVIVLGERLSLQYVFGAALMAMGLALIAKPPS